MPALITGGLGASGGGGGGAPPAVAVVSPASGSSIGPTSVLVVDVTDAGGLRRVVLSVTFSGLASAELVHDGDGFAPLYAPASARVDIAGGYRFSLTRSGGWPASPTLKVIAVDVTGQEA